jgi:transposase
MEVEPQFMEELVCPSCGHEGHATWNSPDIKGGLRNLATLSDGFKMWPPREGADPLITCKTCGTPQPDQKSVGA